MLGQTAELLDQGQEFAERFGWEAFVIVAVLIFVGVLTWRVGGKIAGAISDFLQASITQLNSQAETQTKTSEAITLLSATAATNTDCQNRIEETTKYTHAKMEKMLDAVLSAARIAYDLIPDEDQETKTKLLRVIHDLEK